MNNPQDITKLDLVALKALAFDQLNLKALVDNNLKAIDEELRKRSDVPKEPVADVPVPAEEACGCHHHVLRR